ncbi:putative AP2 domain-containing protein/putative DNA-binding protein [Bacillus phage pW2]|uniref:Putative AP2 domain-containing protein/putative DNA-binding protein n=1 Tax=Bacillus phage pW2 TaxID=2500559 RepID=A0A3Q9R7H4_9CAUD|nr:HNH endonuclease [Bacillus phage pW2]AZU98973.1 putative AP2 domain-containing protein/putative DNA-binding protein [Bacillus phage pW2]
MHKRIGETNTNNKGVKMEIIEYNNANNIIVLFEDGCKLKTKYCHFKSGRIKSLHEPIIANKGYIGQGKYTPTIDGKITRAYQTWSNMIKRCYDERFHDKKHRVYVDCEVCEEWHNFQNFAEWFHHNYYEIFGEMMALDKDILVKGNKIYSPETCVYTPQKINTLFTRNNSNRGDCPIGVHYVKERNKYSARCTTLENKRKELGHYETKEEAFIAYKRFKENVIKDVANEYMGEIPLKLYYAMMTYEVEITD